MAAIFRRKYRGNLSVVLIADTPWVAHDLLGKGLVLTMQVSVDVFVVEILVDEPVNAHAVLYDGVSHGER